MPEVSNTHNGNFSLKDGMRLQQPFVRNFHLSVMKRTKKVVDIVILPLFLLFFYGEAAAQCIADAGQDRVKCYGDKSIIQLGGSPTALGGEAPYTYRWSCNDFYYDTVYTASHYLDDTSAANPTLPNGLGPNMVVFKVEVTDAIGAVCQDEVVLKSSSFLWLLDVKEKTINEGDSVQLYLSITGGIAPYRYQWSPGHSLNDSTLRNPYASPDTTTDYTLLLTDSAGCQGLDRFLVIVWPLSIPEIIEEDLKVYPNPGNGSIEFTHEGGESFTFYLFDNQGKLVYTTATQNATFRLDTHVFEKGVYFYRIQKEKASYFSGKIVLD